MCCKTYKSLMLSWRVATSHLFSFSASFLLCEVKMDPYWVASAPRALSEAVTLLSGTRPFPSLNCSHMCGGKQPPASNSSPGTFPESPTQPLSEHSQYQKHSNCKKRSLWLENPPGHSVWSWRTASAYTFQNWLQMVADKKKKKYQVGKHAHTL